MIDAYDKSIKKHIESFLKVGNRQILAYGLTNESDGEEALFSQVGSTSDKLIFPLVSIIRLPSIQITDESVTKRVSNYEGYVIVNEIETLVKLNVMRCTLQYAVDIFAENRKVAEDLGTQLFFRLRNNPQITVNIQLPIKKEDGTNYSATCIPDLTMEPNMIQLRPQSQDQAQLYKFRIMFQLKNVNIYDVSEKNLFNIEYVVTSRIIAN